MEVGVGTEAEYIAALQFAAQWLPSAQRPGWRPKVVPLADCERCQGLGYYPRDSRQPLRVRACDGPGCMIELAAARM